MTLAQAIQMWGQQPVRATPLPMMLAQGPTDPQAALEAMVRGLPSPQPQIAPQGPVAAPRLPDRINPGTAIQRHRDELNSLLMEIQRQQLIKQMGR